MTFPQCALPQTGLPFVLTHYSLQRDFEGRGSVSEGGVCEGQSKDMKHLSCGVGWGVRARFCIKTKECIRQHQDYFCQQVRCLLKHKMLQFVLKISLYMAPTCFGPSWTIITEHTMKPC